VKNFSSKNAYIQAEIALNNTLTDSYGIACAGCKGFTILSVDAVNTRLKLDGDLADLAKNDAALTAAWSYALDAASGSSCLYVDHVNAPFVYFKSFPEKLKQLSTLTEADCRRIADKDDNGIYCPAYPDAGISSDGKKIPSAPMSLKPQ